ncbi:MAG: hypothetical protein ACLP8X_38545 [Streptosporangiaceae bacterium]
MSEPVSSKVTRPALTIAVGRLRAAVTVSQVCATMARLGHADRYPGIAPMRPSSVSWGRRALSNLRSVCAKVQDRI